MIIYTPIYLHEHLLLGWDQIGFIFTIMLLPFIILEFPLGNIKYIGKSNEPKKRLKNHLKEAKTRNKNHRDKWINSLPESPILKIIEDDELWIFGSEWSGSSG